MTARILFSAAPERWSHYRAPLTRALTAAGVSFDLRPDIAPPEVDYIVYAPNGPLRDFSGFPRLKAVLSLWAGVETIAPNPTLKVPLARMVDTGLKQGMREWVAGHVLRAHLGIDAHVVNPQHRWHPVAPPLARDRPVGILGLGELGRACAETLMSIGFPVTGWSRRPKSVPGMRCLSGPDGLLETLAGAQIVVLLLPDTSATQNILNAATLAALPRGAILLNPGRGALIDDAALLAALDSGHVAQATLDVFRTEPLPVGHPFWTHPGITVTPHIASETRADTASEAIAENIRRGEAGLPFIHLVDRSTGY